MNRKVFLDANTNVLVSIGYLLPILKKYTLSTAAHQISDRISNFFQGIMSV
jgi:hypothetical protein